VAVVPAGSTLEREYDSQLEEKAGDQVNEHLSSLLSLSLSHFDLVMRITIEAG
jgi:hypothetical protein